MIRWMLVSAGLLSAFAPLAADEETAAWQDDYGHARTVARTTGKPLMVVFR